MRVGAQTRFPQARAQVHAARETFAPALCTQGGAAVVVFNFTQDRFVLFGFQFVTDAFRQSRQQFEDAPALVFVIERIVQDFRQPFFGRGLLRAYVHGAEQSVYAIEQQCVLAGVRAQVLVELLEFRILERGFPIRFADVIGHGVVRHQSTPE